MVDPRPFRPIAIVGSIALVGFIVFAVVSSTTDHNAGEFPTVPAPSQLRAGERAPAFSLARLGGGSSVSFAGHAPQPVVVNFFASWCADCVAELRAFASVSTGSTTTRFVGVDSDDSSPATAERLLHQAGVSYSVGVDPSGTVADRYLVSALPVTFFISTDGSVQGELFGTATIPELRAWITRLHSGRDART